MHVTSGAGKLPDHGCRSVNRPHGGTRCEGLKRKKAPVEASLTGAFSVHVGGLETPDQRSVPCRNCRSVKPLFELSTQHIRDTPYKKGGSSRPL
jgi:hypothetical protein